MSVEPEQRLARKTGGHVPGTSADWETSRPAPADSQAGTESATTHERIAPRGIGITRIFPTQGNEGVGSGLE